MALGQHLARQREVDRAPRLAAGQGERAVHHRLELVAVAQLLRDCTRSSDLVGRLGGDEFVAWLAEIDETAAAAKASEILRRAANELGALSAEDAPPIGASVGIAMVSTAGAEDVEGLIARADDAMYAAKRGGKHRFVVAPAPDAAAAE